MDSARIRPPASQGRDRLSQLSPRSSEVLIPAPWNAAANNFPFGEKDTSWAGPAARQVHSFPASLLRKRPSLAATTSVRSYEEDGDRVSELISRLGRPSLT